METVNEENKVVEYEIITTKKYRQVVKVQFDEKYSDELDETKITPSDINFGLGEEIDDETFEAADSAAEICPSGAIEIVDE